MGDWRQFRTEGFDLALTIKSGQFFRYYEERGGFITVTQRKTIELRQKGNALFYRGADEEFVRRFLGLVPEHEHAMARLKLDPVIAPIIARYRGLRLMRLDLHESIIGFICSSMSNIPKIRMNLHRLSASSGDSVGGHHHLPAPGKKLDHAMVLAARTGYRAKFIVEANRMLTRNMLSEIRSADYPRSHELLCALPGVGLRVPVRSRPRRGVPGGRARPSRDAGTLPALSPHDRKARQGVRAGALGEGRGLGAAVHLPLGKEQSC